MSKTSEHQSYPQSPILKRDGFQFCQGVFSVDNVGRVGGSRLHELFNPSTLRLKRDQNNAAEEARKLFKKAFFAAQLRYYGISFRSSLSSADLSSLLEDAVRQGKCNHVPQSVTELESSMRADHEPLHHKWEADCAAWNAEKKRRDDEAFKNCKTPDERATFDPNRFMDLYFLTDRKPDKAKTTEPLALRGYHDKWKLHNMAEKVPGLHTYSGGLSPDRELCIGWNREEVFKLASSISDRADKANKAQQKAKWEQQLEIHQKYTAQMQSKETSNGANKHPKAFSLDRCQGSYVIQCREITEGWLDDLRGHTHTMDISSGSGNTLRATYDFGIIEGAMILSLSEDTLQTIVSEDNLDSEASLSDEDDEDEDDEDSTSGKKRKLGKASLAQASAALRDANAKRRKTTPLPSLSRRVYFRLRGRETGEGEVFSNPDSGHIDFLSDSCATFAGLVYDLTHVGENVEFRGYKVSDTPREKLEDWESFSHAAYEYARVGRWR